MKAIVYHEYGSPEVLQLKEVEKTIPGHDEVLVKVHAASVNAYDWHFMRGVPFVFRFDAGFPKPKHSILGADIAGRVEAVGGNVTQFQPGDEVFGDTSAHNIGGFAEYVCTREDLLTHKPSNTTFEEAAAVPMAALTALQGLRNVGQIRSGQKVLINGASGGVGSFAVQIAKSFGAEVTGVCSTRKMDLVRSIGADHVIDYKQEDFTRSGQHYDLILEVAANHSVADYKRALSPQGRCVVAGFSTLFHLLFQVMLLGLWASRIGSQKIGMMKVMKPNQEDLVFVRELLEAGKIKSVVDRSYPLSETAEAIRYLEEGHAQGKVVITVGYNNKT